MKSTGFKNKLECPIEMLQLFHRVRIMSKRERQFTIIDCIKQFCGRHSTEDWRLSLQHQVDKGKLYRKDFETVPGCTCGCCNVLWSAQPFEE